MAFWLLQADTQGTSLEPDPPAGSVRAMVVIAPDEDAAREACYKPLNDKLFWFP